jgi:hypothetical protein
MSYKCTGIAEAIDLHRPLCQASDFTDIGYNKQQKVVNLIRKACVCRNCRLLIQEEIKRRLNSGNARYYSVQNLLSSRLLSKNLKIRIYKTIILPVVLYECETWSLILR